MLKGELEPFGVQIGPTSPSGLKFPYHLQNLLKMDPGSFGPVHRVPLDPAKSHVDSSGKQDEVKDAAMGGVMLFRQGLHANGWTAIFQQQYVPAAVIYAVEGTGADANKV
jgi:hypothetical protein